MRDTARLEERQDREVRRRAEWVQDQFVQRALLAAIVESSDDAIVSKTLDGRILSWNAGATRIFGYTAEEAVGQPITMIIPHELQDEERAILEKLKRGERIDHFDTIRVTKAGVRIPISLTVSPIRDAEGTIVGASKVARDISERKWAEARVRETEEALLAADRHKDEFLALLAHELRNFVAPIQYGLATVQNANSSGEQKCRAVEIMERQLRSMRHVLDDLLDASRIRSGKLELKVADTDLGSIIATAVETARPVIEARNHTLTLEVPLRALPLRGDPVRLAQVFSNLLINAAKYTEPGGKITLRARREDGGLHVAVSDNGIGMSRETIARVFELFAQAPTAHVQAQGGLGIGLALVRAILVLHGGRVEAHSDGARSGSTFTVHLPAASG